MHRNSSPTPHDAAVHPDKSRGERLEALESIRGLAALAVVCWHLTLAFFPYVLAARGQELSFASLLTGTPLRIVIDGAFAVRIFFVLSGVALSFGFFQRPSYEVLWSATIRRYFRLAPPIVFSVLCAYLLLDLGWYFNRIVGAEFGESGNWLRILYGFKPRLSDALREGFLCPVTFGYKIQHTYNPVLWTIPIEMYGSLLVFATLAAAGRLRRRFLVYFAIGAAICIVDRIYLNFIVGIALCDAFVVDRRHVRPFEFGALSGTLLILCGLCIGSLNAGWFPTTWTPLMRAVHADLRALGATLVIGAVLFCPFWRRALQRPTLTALGRYSFSLYLLHLPILCSLGCYSFLLVRTLHFSVESAGAIASVIVVAATLSAARICYVWVDRPSIALAKQIEKILRPFKTRSAESRAPREVAPTEAPPLTASATTSS